MYLTLNESKSVLSSSTINILGYLIGNGVVRPDPERLRPCRNFLLQLMFAHIVEH